MKRYVNCLTIAGSDSGGGAGIQADIKTISAHGLYAMSAITAITAQNTIGVTDIQAVSGNVVKAQIENVLSDIGADAIKIGMVYTADNAHIISDAIDKFSPHYVVLDPVLVSTTKCNLSTLSCKDAIKELLIKRSTLITPNIDEAESLSDIKISSRDDMVKAAEKIIEIGARAVLVKGGDLEGETSALDFFITNSGYREWFSLPFVKSRNTHGTGCTLSSAIASNLALGYDLRSAIIRAKEYIYNAILNGSDIEIGKGRGGVNHFYSPKTLIKK